MEWFTIEFVATVGVMLALALVGGTLFVVRELIFEWAAPRRDLLIVFAAAAAGLWGGSALGASTGTPLLTFVCAIIGAALGGVGARLIMNPPAVNRSYGALTDYVEEGESVAHATKAPSATSHQEVEAEVRRKVAPEAGDGIVCITQKALQGQLEVARAEAAEAAMIKLFAVIQEHGGIPQGKATKIKKAAFGISEGRQLTKLNKAIDEATVPERSVEDTPPLVVTPVAGRAVPVGVSFSGGGIDSAT